MIPPKKCYYDFFKKRFFLIFPAIVCFKKYIEKIGHRACLRDTTGKTYPIYASTGPARYFIGSRYISVAKSKGFKVTPKKKNLIGIKSLERMEKFDI